jgi:hypothetical protein
MNAHIQGFWAAALWVATAGGALDSAYAATAATPASTPTTANIPAANRPAVHYRSAFEGYRAFDDPRPLAWRDANDMVGRIGGWKAYARESAGQGPDQAHDHHQHQLQPTKP